MKIGRKLTLSNIIITVAAMIILSIIISSIISEYIENDIKDDLVKDNQYFVKLLSDYSGKFLEYDEKGISINLDYFKKNEELPILIAVFNMKEQPELINASDYLVKETVSEIELKNMYTQEVNQVYETRIWNKSFLAYNESVRINVNAEQVTLMVTTLISNENVKEIVNQIVLVLVVVIAIICILIVLINKYLQKMITRPIQLLVKTSEAFSKKHFDKKAVLHTGDEFETLAIAMNNMADSLEKQDLEQKSFMKIYPMN